MSPVVIAGPMVRRVTSTQCQLWIVTSVESNIDVSLFSADKPLPADLTQTCLAIGQHAFVSFVTLTPSSPLPEYQDIHYALSFSHSELNQNWQTRLAQLCYPNHSLPFFQWRPTLSRVAHGSCRKPHHAGGDALVALDTQCENEIDTREHWPDILLMTGDQIYADDVAGPMLTAIQQVESLLGLKQEPLEGAVVKHGSELVSHPHNLYQREQILPQIKTNTALSKMLFGAKKKPVFTSVNAQNHLITCSEIMAMYLLVWSPTLWETIDLDNATLSDTFRSRYAKEQQTVARFATGLPSVARLFAHIPTYMIFDDHDVTDDWNLTRAWEEEVYGHPLSRRMIGNALIGYFVFQGWGNNAAAFDELLPTIKQFFSTRSLNDHDRVVDEILEFHQWGYQLPTHPPVSVLDTRTERWRSESSENKPSGLMDWEALCDFQQSVIDKPSIIMVSAAPVFGVKLIEAIQKVFTFFGKALTVDAENWMAHKGTANVMLNIFKHYRTPPRFIILSGDVHYSFVYDVKLRFKKHSPHIVQFTCSGFKNAFPPALIRWLDRWNRLLYSVHSPLNVFTRRRDMSVNPRFPTPGQGEIYNGSAVGILSLDKDGKEIGCTLLCSNGEKVEFTHSE